jgi:hypothetical protein
MIIMKTNVKYSLLIVILFVMAATPTLGQQDGSLSVAITGKGTNFGQVTPTDPGVLTSITPSDSKQCQSLCVIITGSNTHFGQATQTGGDLFSQCTPTTSQQGTPTVADVWLSQGSSTIDWVCGWKLCDTLFSALFDIPDDANAGKWDVHVNVFQQCTPTTTVWTLTLSDGFTIAQPGDITCDGVVNFFDVAVLGNHWLEGAGE